MTTLAVMVMIVTSAAAMSFSKARKEALFLSDKMAYELELSLSQYEAVYEINLDYFLGLYDPADLDGVYWLRRNADLRYVLSPWQWDLYTRIVDFYRPMSWVRRHSFSLVLRTRYTTSNHFFYDRPTVYYSFRGGHNVGNTSYYYGREFHRPSHRGAQMHFGSSAPSAYGTVKPNSKSYPSYHIGEAKPATSHGTTRSGVATGGTTNQNVGTPATTATRPQTFGGSQRGNSTTRSGAATSSTTQRTSAVPQRTTTTQRSATTTTAPQRSTSSTTSGTTSSGSTRGNSGTTRGNSGGSRGR